MKKLIRKLSYGICIALVVFSFCELKAQTIDTTLTSVGVLETDSTWHGDYCLGTLAFSDEVVEVNTILFKGDSTKFWLNMKGDSLVWGGNMKLTESAKTFINFCDDYWYSKIDSLETELAAIRKKYCN